MLFSKLLNNNEYSIARHFMVCYAIKYKSIKSMAGPFTFKMSNSYSTMFYSHYFATEINSLKILFRNTPFFFFTIQGFDIMEMEVHIIYNSRTFLCIEDISCTFFPHVLSTFCIPILSTVQHINLELFTCHL